MATFDRICDFSVPLTLPQILEPIADLKGSGQQSVEINEELQILIQQLRTTLKDDKIGKCPQRRDDDFLAKFLRVRDYDVQRAATSVRNYYRTLTRNRDIVQNVKPSQFLRVYKSNISTVLPAKCKNGTIVLLIQTDFWNPNKISLQEIIQAYWILFEHTIQSPDMQVNGVSLIIDLKGLSLTHLLQLTPRHLKMLIYCAQDGLPLKVKGMHIINHPLIFSRVFWMVQRLIKEKLRQRIHFHDTPDTLTEYFHVEGLPTSLGGVLEVYDGVQKHAVDEILKYDQDISACYLPQEPECE